MTNEVTVSDRVLAISNNLTFEVDDRGVAKGTDTGYVDSLAEGLSHHKAFDRFGKALPNILKSDVTDEEKKDKIIDKLMEYSEDIIRAKHAYDAEFIAAAGRSFGLASQDFIKKNPGVNRVVGSVQEVGRNKFNFTYDQEYDKRTPPRDGQPAKVEKAYGRLQVALDQVGSRKTAAQLIAVRKELAERAASGLSD